MHESSRLELNDGAYVAIQMLKSNRRFAACRHYLFLTKNVSKSGSAGYHGTGTAF